MWAAIEDVGLPISQHGGTGAPAYGPPGFAAIMTLAFEHSFFSGRSLWQLIAGGVFDRFPGLKVVFVETEVDWIGPAHPAVRRRHGAWATTGWLRRVHGARAGLQPPAQRVLGHRTATPGCRRSTAAQCSGSTRSSRGRHDRPRRVPLRAVPTGAMFGVDYPHFETLYPGDRGVAAALDTPG